MGAASFIFGLHKALNWAWDWSLQTGNIFIQISVPTNLLVFTGVRLFYWILSAVGLLVLIIFGTMGRRRAQSAIMDGINPFWAPRFRFYALTFVLGLFLTYFGIVFLFHASVTGDDTPAGLVAFVYLNYAGIVRRSIVSIIALVMLVTGVGLASFVAFKPGLGSAAPRPLRPQPVTAPVAEAPAPTVVAPTIPRLPTPRASKPAPSTRPAPTKVAPRTPTRVPTRAVTAVRRPRAPSTSRSS